MCFGAPLTEEAMHSKEIDQMLKKEKKVISKVPEFKLLLLGAGESGKTTIAKQMKILHMNGFVAEERAAYAKIARGNTIRGMKTIVKYAQKWQIPLDSERSQRAAENVINISSTECVLTQDNGADIRVLWGDTGVQKVYARSNEFQLNDTAPYFFDSVERIASPTYVPTDQDILNTRQVTCGISEIYFAYNEIHFRMVDVGGQRSQRRKWIQCFQGVHAVIFVTSLSEYDQKLYEDSETNRMHESLLLFDEICNNVWFRDTAIILFLNKTDLFQMKVKRSPLTVCYPDYPGQRGNADEGMEYICTQFLNRNRSEEREIYPHFTCATNTENIRFVFDAVKDIVMRANLRYNDLMY